jgi:dGTP triphosphohydrolase
MEESIIYDELQHDCVPVCEPGYEADCEPSTSTNLVEFADEIKLMIQILPKSQMREFQSRLDKRSIRADDTENVRPIAERLLAAYSRKKERSKTAYASLKTVPATETIEQTVEQTIEVVKQPIAKKVIAKPIVKPIDVKQSVTLKSLLN